MPESGELDPKQDAKNERQKERERAKIERARAAKEEERQRKALQREAKKAERERRMEEVRLMRELKKECDAAEREQKKREEKERKEQERLLKKQMLEEERAQKHEKKKRKSSDGQKCKDDEKRRKEDRSQMPISSFFAVSKEPVSVAKKNPAQSLPAKSEHKPRSYEADFLPFFQKSNVVMAAGTQLREDELQLRVEQFDKELVSGAVFGPSTVFAVEFSLPSKSHTTSQALVDALNSPHMTESTVLQLVINLPPIKYLKFYENSKPPYVGTWCSEEHLKIAHAFLDPLDTSVTGYDYAYDSDLDWQDEGEGEDVDDLEDGEDVEEDGDDDMDDFVDNSELLRKRGIVGPQQSFSIWNDQSTTNAEIFDGLKFERLDINVTFPIDPYMDYWGSQTAVSEQPVELKAATIPANTAADGPMILTPQKPIIKDQKVIDDLIKFIEKNSDFTIGTLTELAKKEFNIYTKTILKYTIQNVAVYNKKENMWKIKEPVQP
ncbi:hypothetical protein METBISCDRAFT_13055 [Metschnikowia bicuspidata]|uniref:Chromatin assembly factor 1 subunit A n=1 Tax=Metschnikowia bicuspidata TaxID=27322 RepID=A0A4P9ZFT2_9ASCO|nr:hypothetical protein METBISCDRAFT_13055 [Metschnikowia bicuspidata]